MEKLQVKSLFGSSCGCSIAESELLLMKELSYYAETIGVPLKSVILKDVG